MTNNIRWSAAILGAVGTLALVIGAAFAWVAMYAHLPQPGIDQAAVQTYANAVGPVIGVALSFPVWFVMCRWYTRCLPAPRATAYAAPVIAILLDVASLRVMSTPYHIGMCTLRALLKVLGVYTALRGRRGRLASG